MTIPTPQAAWPFPIAKPALPHSIDLVREFQETFNHRISPAPTVADSNLRRLRVLLVLNELAELAQALGVPCELEVKPARADSDPKAVMNGMVKHEWVAPAPLCISDGGVDLVETADALADLDYVVQGANLVFGLPSHAVMREVHSSNMSKLGADGKPIYDANGKVVKGPNFREPDIKAVLDASIAASRS